MNNVNGREGVHEIGKIKPTSVMDDPFLNSVFQLIEFVFPTSRGFLEHLEVLVILKGNLNRTFPFKILTGSKIPMQLGRREFVQHGLVIPLF